MQSASMYDINAMGGVWTFGCRGRMCQTLVQVLIIAGEKEAEIKIMILCGEDIGVFK